MMCRLYEELPVVLLVLVGLPINFIGTLQGFRRILFPPLLIVSPHRDKLFLILTWEEAHQ